MIRWRIINESAAPIVRINIPTYKTYDHIVPDAWDHEDSHSFVHVWVTDQNDAVRPGRSIVLQSTGSSGGGTPGLTTATITLADGRVVQIHDVPTFAKESLMTIALPPVLVSALIVLLVLWRRRSSAQPQQP